MKLARNYSIDMFKFIFSPKLQYEIEHSLHPLAF